MTTIMQPRTTRHKGRLNPHRLPRRSGFATVELALCLPILLTTALGMIETCNVVFVQARMQSAAFEAARLATRPTTAQAVAATSFAGHHRRHQPAVSVGGFRCDDHPDPQQLDEPLRPATLVTVSIYGPVEPELRHLPGAQQFTDAHGEGHDDCGMRHLAMTYPEKKPSFNAQSSARGRNRGAGGPVDSILFILTSVCRQRGLHANGARTIAQSPAITSAKAALVNYGTTNSQSSAVSFAQTVANQNKVAGSTLSLSSVTSIFGQCNSRQRRCLRLHCRGARRPTASS